MNITYGYIRDGAITAPVAMRSTFDGVGAWHTLTDEVRAEHGWHQAEVINEGYDQRTQERSGPLVSFDGAIITVEYTITDKPLETIRQESLEELADIRYAREIEGVTSADGIQQWTDRANRALLTDKISFMSNNPEVEKTSWKARNGFVQLDIDGLKGLQSLVGLHVDQTYKAENSVSDLIVAAETIEDLLSVNIAEEFESAFSGS